MDNSEVITAEQYDLHPEYAAAGLKVGDPVPAEQPSTTATNGDNLQAASPAAATEPSPSAASTEVPAEPVATPEPAPADVTTPVLRYAGKVIVSATDRIVEERSFKSIRLEDGSTCDISEEEYQEIVKASQQ